MRNGILIILICLSACAWTPKDEAWKVSLETAAPAGIDGNCLPVARTLQQKYGGRIAVISHQNRKGKTHAVLMLDGGRILDNGATGYEAQWAELQESGWVFRYWYDKRANRI